MLKNKPTNFNELGYKIPKFTPQESASKALKLLREINDLDPGLLPYALEPSNLLLFAGLRAISPYNELSGSISNKRAKKFEDILNKHGYGITSEVFGYGNFEIVCMQSIIALPETYTFLSTDDGQMPLPVSDTTESILAWSYRIEHEFAEAMERNIILPREWLGDWWAPHNLRFGMLLGYPGVAISSSNWSTSKQFSHKPLFPMSTVVISEYNASNGAQVSFEVAESELKNAEVTAIADLWKSTLQIIHSTIDKEGILKNEKFLEAMREKEKLF